MQPGAAPAPPGVGLLPSLAPSVPWQFLAPAEPTWRGSCYLSPSPGTHSALHTPSPACSSCERAESVPVCLALLRTTTLHLPLLIGSPPPCSHVAGHLRALLVALVFCVCGYERLLPLVSGCCPERQVTAEASAAGAQGTEPGMVYSSAQTANGLGDIAAPHGGLGAAINQGAPLQQPLPPPRSSVLGGASPGGLWHSQAGLSQYMNGPVGLRRRVCVHTYTYRSVCRCSFMFPCLNVCVSVPMCGCMSMFVPMRVHV